MFRKTPQHPQTDLLSSVDQHLDSRRQKALHDPTGWHNSFYHEIFIHIDESIFQPIYDSTMGAPNAPVNQLVAMMVLKDAMGLSDQQLFEACRFHLLYRQALGCVNLSDRVPTESTYYKFRSMVEGYQREHEVDLFGQIFAGITSDQVIRFSLSGKQVRMDSKLIGSNIAFYCRFELVYATLMKFYAPLNEHTKARMAARVATRMAVLAQEDAESVVYHSTSEQMQDKLAELGRLTHQLLSCYTRDDNAHYELLERMFHEQFVVETEGEDTSDSDDDEQGIVARPSGEIGSQSLQSPHDPDCSYRKKAGEQTKGYSLNVAETIEEDQLHLITDIQLEPAHHGDADFVEPSITQTQQRTHQQVETCYADGAYNRSLEHEEDDRLGHVEMVLSGIQGAPSRFILEETEDGIEVTDTQTGRVHQGVAVRRRDRDAEPRWRIRLEDQTYRYFGRREIRAGRQRSKLCEQEHRERTRKRNNVEATIYHLSHRLRQGKTVYRGLMRTKLWAWGRALWVNMRRIQRYTEKEVNFVAQQA